MVDVLGGSGGPEAVSGPEMVSRPEAVSGPGGPDSLVPIGQDWGMWPVVLLRSAGHAAEQLRDFLAAAEEQRHTGSGLREVVERFVSDPWLLEALCWQNPTIVNSWLGRYATDGVSGTKRPTYYRGKLLSLGAYLQRYATRNETIGFFGPIGWAHVDQDRDLLVEVAGKGERVRHTTYFEPWALTALARSWEADPEVRWRLPVIVNQAGVLRDDTFVRPRRGPHRLTADQRLVLTHLGGSGYADELLEALRAADGPAWDRARLTEVLTTLQRAECLFWGFDITVVGGSEKVLDAQLDRLPAELRDRLRDDLHHLSRLRQDVSAAAGDATGVWRTTNALAESFETISGVDRSVQKASNPDCRELLYHDVTVDWDATLGGRAVAGLAGPLELLMETCRYASWRFATGIEDRARVVLRRDPALEAVFDELLPELNDRRPGRILRGVTAEVRQIVADLLAAEPGVVAPDGSLVHRSAALRERWRAAFAAPRAGWSAAALHSADVMLARQGDEQLWVLGEAHTTVNPLDYRFCLENQPEPGRLEALIDAATPAERFIPAMPPTPRLSPRTAPPPAAYLPDKHRYWTLWPRTAMPASVPKLSCVDLRVVEQDGTVVVVDGTGQVVARLTEFIGEFLSLAFYNTLSLFSDADRMPRVRIDDLVVQRAYQRIPVREFAPLLSAPPSRVELAGFFRERGLPRYSFIRVPGEPKPVFCDATSWVTTHNVVRLLRKVADQPEALVKVQEMLPDFDELWLTGPDGRTRTSEFRFVVQDLKGSVVQDLKGSVVQDLKGSVVQDLKGSVRQDLKDVEDPGVR
ncbi:Lantibiotic dehydratase, C terminus [Micromonospora pallida]|uniref:Lantibiotic dehydratase, C terminus n=1 Tax=Micromonospora pallida TaxID=145854 RepID=A0A1C6S9M8_9ACTN|nr:lantibiotic dehydratase [Micromonospora pallida]SCL26180.1 Lantibiotic dehydratase, C terminus [Micromonospora pallida]